MWKLSGALSASTLALTVLLPPEARAQATEEHAGRWGLSIAGSHQSVNDEIASPLRQTGLGPAVGLLYRTRGRHSDWGLGGRYGNRSLESGTSREGGSSEDVHDFTLHLSYLRRVHGTEGARFAVYAGVGSEVRLVVRIHQYGVLGSETYADGFAPLEAQSMWIYDTGNRGVWSGRLAVAALSAVGRDPYTGTKYVPRIEMKDPVHVPAVRHILSYRFSMGSSFDGVLSHELTYFRYPEPRYMVMATQDLRFTLEWKR